MNNTLFLLLILKNKTYLIMKKLVITILAIVTLASCSQPKLGVVNTEKLIKEYKGTVKVEADIKEKNEITTKELEKLFQAFQVKVGVYQRTAAKMSPSERAAKEQELGAEQQMLQQKQQQAEFKAQNDGQKAIKKIAETVNSFVNDYGKNNGYQIIFGTVDLNGAVMYNEETVDITETILTSLNEAYEKDNATTTAKTEETSVKTEEAKKEEKVDVEKEEAKK